jgi:hypothetical protein
MVRWTWSPALGLTRNPRNLRITVGKLAASILAPRPSSRAVDHATKDCNARAQIRIPVISVVPASILLRLPARIRAWRRFSCASASPGSLLTEIFPHLRDKQKLRESSFAMSLSNPWRGSGSRRCSFSSSRSSMPRRLESWPSVSDLAFNASRRMLGL